MPMLIYQPSHATRTEFINFWRGVYHDAAETLYSDNIRQELTEQRILELFKWKNGGRLARHKEESVRHNFVEHRGELEQLQPDQDIENLLAHFPNGGVISRIFWLHCWRPEHFPIYDQYVHRAMKFILTGELLTIPPDDAAKIASYKNEYVPFHHTFDGIDIQAVDPVLDRTVDKALWTFGMFLKRNPNFPTAALVP
jgi:aromatic ring-cleaving dioxygenase